MKVSYQWLKEYVDIPVDAPSLASELTNIGLQLESIIPAGEDTILDLEVTVNRPDCLSVLGLSREIAVIFDSQEPSVPDLHPAGIRAVEGNEGNLVAENWNLTIRLEDPDLCPRYCGQLITGVQIGSSPDWMRTRLENSGIRSINNVVDISNLVMLELGQPLHAFDFEKLKDGTIRIRRAENEKLMMIDERVRLLTDPMLVIADASRAQAVGGVMGGKDSEVTEQTKTILLESAYFQPSSIRKTARALELSTDASYRFERGIDYRMQAIACKRAAFLLQKYAGGTVHPVLDVSQKFEPPQEIQLRTDRVQRILGQAIPQNFMRQKLIALGFQEIRKDVWVPPSYRVDVFKEIDLIEEVVRHYGYNRIPETLPATEKRYQADYPTMQLEEQLSEYFRSVEVDEASTSSFINPLSSYARQFKAADRVTIENPVAETASELRDSLLPNLMESVEHNIRHRNLEIRLFEIGRIFSHAGEKISLAVILLGEYTELKGIIENAFPALRMPAPIVQNGSLLLLDKNVGRFYQFSIESYPVQACEISLDELVSIPRTNLMYLDIIPYPVVERDITFLLDEGIPYAEMEEVIQSLAITELRSFRLIDRYRGKNTPPGKVSLTFRFTYQSTNRTLTAEEVERFHNSVLNLFSSRFSAELRS